MARRVAVSLVALLIAVLLATSCVTEPVGIPLRFTRAILTHRGEHLVLDVAAVVLPDSSPANVTCTGAVTASGVGVVRDSLPVVHHDTAQVFRAICTAEWEGASTTDTAAYTLYGPSLMGAWIGRGTVAGQRVRFEIRSLTVPCRNPWVIEDTDYGTWVADSCVAIEAGTPDSFSLRGHHPNPALGAWRLEASRRDYTIGEYRLLRGMIWTSRLGDLTNFAPYLVERN